MTRQLALISRAQSRLAAMFGPLVAGAIYRSPAESNGQVDAPALLASGVDGWRRPATEDARQAGLFPVMRTPTNSTRVFYILKVAAGTDIRIGDRWLESGTYYNVEGVARFHTATLCAISEVKSS